MPKLFAVFLMLLVKSYLGTFFKRNLKIDGKFVNAFSMQNLKETCVSYVLAE